MKKVAYEKSKVLRVTRDELVYLDDEGMTCAINFHVCRKNVQRELRSPGWIRLKESEDVYVGYRDFSAKPPHITFASDPQTRFEFPMPKPGVAVPSKRFLRFDPEDFRDYHEFQMRLFQEAGVKTLDMG